ncbi:MAG: hypothetical protein FJ241_02285 [Nitrospira sp.]|nr:hypothetical protein [Nitrospira sp.]
MEKKEFLKTKGFYLITFLLILFILQPLNLSGQEGVPEKTSKTIEIKNNLISLDVKGVDLSEVLKEIEKGTGVRITIVGKELIGKKLTKSFKNLDIEKALRSILGEDYVFVFLKDLKKKDKYILKEVKVGVLGSKPSKVRMITKEIAYGKGKEEVGLLSMKDLRRGPESFSNDAEGNLYICDTVNRRIQIFSPDGTHLYEIPLKEGMEANDIAIDKSGHIYIYDIQGKLYQYDKKGNFLTMIDVDSERWRSRRHIHIVGNDIYIRSGDQEDILIGRIVEGLLVAPKGEELSLPQKGIYGFSGNRYLVNLTRWERGGIEIINTRGDIVKSIELPMKGIVSISFLQEDKKGNFYIQTERTDNENLFLEVQKFDSDGNYLTTVLIPESDYSGVWGIKLLSLDENGTIYQVVTEKERAQINIFQ